MLQILSTSNETSTGTELVQNGNFSEIGSDLVTNGDFSAEGINLVDNPNFTDTGSELITNGDFATGDMTGWSVGSSGDGVTPTAVSDGSGGYGALISNGVTSGNSYITQNSVFEEGKSYKVSYRIVSNSLPLTNFLTLEDYDVAIPSTVGTHDIFVVGLSTELRAVFKRASANTNIVITDISIKELGADWTVTNAGVGNIVQFNENGAYLKRTVSSATEITQSVYDITKNYKVVIDYSDVSGGVSIEANGDLSRTSLSEGVNTFYIAPSSVDIKIICTNNTAEGTVNSVSVQELGEGWSVTMSDGSATTSLKYVEFVETGARFVSDVTAAPYLYLAQSTLSSGKLYKFTCNVAYTGTGVIKVYVGGESTSLIEGVNTIYSSLPTTANTLRFLRNADDVDCIISNVTIQELDPNGYWTLVGSGLTIGEDKGIYTDAGVGSYFKNTSFVVVDGKTYRGSFDIPELTEGGLSWQTALGTVSISPNYGAADTGLTFDFVGDGSTGIKCIGTTLDNTSAITNLSVKLLGTYDDQSIYVTAADVQTIAQASVYYLVELTSMGSKNSLYFLPSSVVPNNGRYTKLNFTVISKDALPQPTVGIISFYDSVGGFDTYPMGFYEFRIYEQTSSTNLDPLLATGLLEKGFAFVRDFSGNMQELTDGFKEYNPTLTQYVYSK